MTKFRGRAHIKLDQKGRLSLPSTFRSSLNKPYILVATNGVFKGLPCLDLLTSSEWQKLELKISKISALKAEAQVFQRFYISGSERCELDVQLRILLPQHLREYAELEESIVLVGMGHKIEIWSEKNWQTIFAKLKTDFEVSLNVLANLDLGGKAK